MPLPAGTVPIPGPIIDTTGAELAPTEALYNANVVSFRDGRVRRIIRKGEAGSYTYEWGYGDDTLGFNEQGALGLSEGYKTQTAELGASQFHTFGWALDRQYRSEDFFGPEGSTRRITGMEAFEGNPVVIDSTGLIGIFGGSTVEPPDRASFADDPPVAFAKNATHGWIATAASFHHYNIDAAGAWTINIAAVALTGNIDIMVPPGVTDRMLRLTSRDSGATLRIGFYGLNNGILGGSTDVFDFTLAQLQAAFPDSALTDLAQCQAIAASGASEGDTVQVYCRTDDHAFTLSWIINGSEGSRTLEANPAEAHRTGYVDSLSGATLLGTHEFISTEYVVRRYDRLPSGLALRNRGLYNNAINDYALGDVVYTGNPAVEVEYFIVVNATRANANAPDASGDPTTTGWGIMLGMGGSGGTVTVDPISMQGTGAASTPLATRPLGFNGGLPQASSEWIGRTVVDLETRLGYVCDDLPHVTSVATGTFATPSFVNPIVITFEANRADWPNPGRNQFLYVAYENHFYSAVDVRPNVLGWVQDTADDALADALDGSSFTVHWLGPLDTDADAAEAIGSLTADTNYFFFDRTMGRIRKLDNSTFIAAGDLVTRPAWVPLEALDFRRSIFAAPHGQLPSLPADGTGDNRIGIAESGIYFPEIITIPATEPTIGSWATYADGTAYLGALADEIDALARFTANGDYYFNTTRRTWREAYTHPSAGPSFQDRDPPAGWVGSYSDRLAALYGAQGAGAATGSNIVAYTGRIVETGTNFTAAASSTTTRTWHFIEAADRPITLFDNLPAADEPPTEIGNLGATLPSGGDTNITSPLTLAAAPVLPLSVGDMLLIDSEWVLITEMTSQQAFTVLRGVNGTTSVTHGNNSTVSRDGLGPGRNLGRAWDVAGVFNGWLDLGRAIPEDYEKDIVIDARYIGGRTRDNMAMRFNAGMFARMESHPGTSNELNNTMAHYVYRGTQYNLGSFGEMVFTVARHRLTAADEAAGRGVEGNDALICAIGGGSSHLPMAYKFQTRIQLVAR